MKRKSVKLMKMVLALCEKRIVYMDSKSFLKIKYWYKLNKKLNIDSPKTFNEKLQWLKLNDKNPKYIKMVDKYEAKKYVSNIIGEKHVIPTIGLWNNVEEIDFEKLPNKFVLKCTHDSGGIIICKNKESLNINEVKNKLKKSLKRNYYYEGREWPYKHIAPRIIAEKYMEDESKQGLKDYKIFNFNGEPKLILVDIDRFSEHKRKVYTVDWEEVDINLNYPNDKNIKIPKPKNLSKMIELSRKLAENHIFIRTDFYIVHDEIYFGELTFYPGAGFQKIEPEEYGIILGDMIVLPIDNKEEKNEK